MSMWQNIGGTWRKGVVWANIGGTWRKVTVCSNVAGVWKKDASGTGGGGSTALTASGDKNYVFGSVNRLGSVRVYTNYVTITAAGGTAPYTFSWSTQPDNWLVETPNGATTRFSSTCNPQDDKVVTFTCTVTDAKSKTATFNVTAEVANYYSGGKGNAQVQ